ncbi:ribosomal protein S18-alanine N-acetyltransferase [Alicyclobacillus sp. SO9]|uniref:ribosomal protein S18-alanine N-acetyltransferase n=1 Tax=Alicyclobacillus sp. SO9 TaxID=2665646 RepID=UPI0018E7ACAC|nr:ribosomal protein S18-alanine N-acetyltransferase [Alicyclobacillus sp. SO9]QQE78605.1 ribosomal protein S18-alanine N-acetyltransferase [Alicyclobacillus sp. SO9]
MAISKDSVPAGQVEYRPMALKDIDGVLDVERQAFATPWSRQAFLTELVDNQFAHYVVAVSSNRIIGYAGVWLIVDEAHVTNIAVHPDMQGKRVGEGLLKQLFVLAVSRYIQRITLEVRVSNSVAQNLYRKYGFQGVGVRKGYYTDNGEDALIMWANVPDMTDRI